MSDKEKDLEDQILDRIGHRPGAQRLAVLAKHVWAQGDTYAGLASKHYGDISEPYWRLIYEFNRAVIGDHPNDIKIGTEIEIPVLPPELKK